MTESVNEKFCNLKHEAVKDIINLHVAKLEDRLDAMDKALRVHGIEMERRLEGLNQLRQDVIKDREQFIKLEVYNPKMKSIDVWITDANDKFTKLMTKYDNRITATTLISGLALIVSAVGIIIMLVRR